MPRSGGSNARWACPCPKAEGPPGQTAARPASPPIMPPRNPYSSSRCDRRAIPCPRPMAMPARHHASDRPPIWIRNPNVLRPAAESPFLLHRHFVQRRCKPGSPGRFEISPPKSPHKQPHASGKQGPAKQAADNSVGGADAQTDHTRHDREKKHARCRGAGTEGVERQEGLLGRVGRRVKGTEEMGEVDVIANLGSCSSITCPPSAPVLATPCPESLCRRRFGRDFMPCGIQILLAAYLDAAHDAAPFQPELFPARGNDRRHARHR